MKTLAIVAVTMAASLLGSGPAQVQDRYAGFSAQYSEFRTNTFSPIRREGLAAGEQGRDVTSLLFKSRFDLFVLLKKAQTPAHFDGGRVRLLLRSNGEEWLVDEPGVVKHQGKELALSDADYSAFRLALFLAMPLNETASLRQPFERNR